jgi:two-component system, cell cycle response regulator
MADQTGPAVIGLLPQDDSAGRIAALRAGVDDVLSRPVRENLLLSRIRSLLRQSAAAPEADLEGQAMRALGLAEDQTDFVPAGRVGVITPHRHRLPDTLGTLVSRLPGGARLMHPSDDPGLPVHDGAAPDIYLIDALHDHETTLAEGTVLQILADLRSRAATRHAATMVILPEGRDSLGAMALDMGADDLATQTTSAEELAHRVRTLLRRKSLADRRRDGVRAGLQAAITDPLTGLYNRRLAMAELGRMVDGSLAQTGHLAVMMLDIDHFKRVNDTWGHAAGDRVLVEVAARLRANLRGMDLIARMGGEEFLVAIPGTGLEGARGAAERLRRVVEDHPFALTDGRPGDKATGTISVTVSVGVAMCGADVGADGKMSDNLALLCARADRALYAAKTAGRNMVTVSAT